MARGIPPQAALEDMEPNKVQELVASLQELHAMGRCETDAEVESRVNEYFAFCQRSSIRPGIESLALALHTTRQSIFNWANGTQCSPQRQEIIQSAKGFIAAYLEQASLSGKINPASGIFLMKNWLNYKDNLGFESVVQDNSNRPAISREELEQQFGTDALLCGKQLDF